MAAFNRRRVGRLSARAHAHSQAYFCPGAWPDLHHSYRAAPPFVQWQFGWAGSSVQGELQPLGPHGHSAAAETSKGVYGWSYRARLFPAWHALHVGRQGCRLCDLTQDHVFDEHSYCANIAASCLSICK